MRENGKQFGMSERQLDLGLRFLQAYKIRHSNILKFKNENPTDDGAYSALFRSRPYGNVELLYGPATIFVKCHDKRDYARIRLGPKAPESISMDYADMEYSTAGVSLGLARIPGLDGAITAENSSLLPNDEQKQKRLTLRTQLHEEQHAIHKLFDLAFNEKLFDDSFKDLKSESSKEKVMTVEILSSLRSMMEHSMNIYIQTLMGFPTGKTRNRRPGSTATASGRASTSSRRRRLPTCTGAASNPAVIRGAGFPANGNSGSRTWKNVPFTPWPTNASISSPIPHRSPSAIPRPMPTGGLINGRRISG